MSDTVEFLVVGLGNPGEEYANTPHNLGFLVIDRLAESAGLTRSAYIVRSSMTPMKRTGSARVRTRR